MPTILTFVIHIRFHLDEPGQRGLLAASHPGVHRCPELPRGPGPDPGQQNLQIPHQSGLLRESAGIGRFQVRGLT